MNFQIKCRFTGGVRFEGAFGALRFCVEAAVKASANLAGADLAGAYLAGANLASANLAGADLAGAYLASANLARADLAGANLARANLASANLASANLARANLASANLASANLARADLAGAQWREGVTLKCGPVKECNRSDGYLFRLLDCDVGWRVAAGCRFFTLDEAWRHWGHGARANTALGEESEIILAMFEQHIEHKAKWGIKA